MKIFIYGDSNTWGYVPNINGYSKEAVPRQYPKESIWWFPLEEENEVVVNGLCGRAINNDNPWLEGRNASKTIEEDLKNVEADLVIVQLGTNDCKSKYALSAKEIAFQMSKLLQRIKEKIGTPILLISPARIKGGNKITDKYYIGAEEKTVELDKLYQQLAFSKGYYFVSGLELETGEDGEHLTRASHKILGEKVLQVVKIFAEENFIE